MTLIGSNGAGRSSFVEILMGLHTPDAGEVRVLGHDVVCDPRPGGAHRARSRACRGRSSTTLRW